MYNLLQPIKNATAHSGNEWAAMLNIIKDFRLDIENLRLKGLEENLVK